MNIKEIRERFDKEAKKNGMGGLARIFVKSFFRKEFTSLLEELEREVERMKVAVEKDTVSPTYWKESRNRILDGVLALLKKKREGDPTL